MKRLYIIYYSNDLSVWVRKSWIQESIIVFIYYIHVLLFDKTYSALKDSLTWHYGYTLAILENSLFPVRENSEVVLKFTLSMEVLENHGSMVDHEKWRFLTGNVIELKYRLVHTLTDE